MDSWRKCQGVIHRCPLQICQSFPKIFGTPKSLKPLKTRHKPVDLAMNYEPTSFSVLIWAPQASRASPPYGQESPAPKDQLTHPDVGNELFPPAGHGKSPLHCFTSERGSSKEKTKCCRSNCLKPKFCQCRFPSISSETNSGKKRPYAKGCPLTCGISWFLLVHLPLDSCLPMHIHVCYALLGSFL